MVLYAIKSAVTLTLLYAGFSMFLSRETFHRFNRFALLCIMMLSLVVPFITIYTAHPTMVSSQILQAERMAEIESQRREMEMISLQPMTEEWVATGWIDAVTWIYWAGVCLVLLRLAVQSIVLYFLVSNGLCHTDKKGNTVVLLRANVTPFSIFHYIVMNVEDYETNHTAILVHEQEHIRLGHTYDNLLQEVVNAVQWFNPMVWMMSRELRNVHEYETDAAVLDMGVDKDAYERLLVQKAMMARLNPLANNLNHGSLRKRVQRMNQRRSKAWRKAKALVAVPAVAAAIACFAKPLETNLHGVASAPQPIALVTPRFIPTGQANLTVAYTNAPTGQGAWIGVYRHDNVPDKDLSVTRTYLDKPSGTVTFDLKDENAYYAVLFADSMYNELARTDHFLVSDRYTDAANFRLTTDKKVYQVGEPVVVNWIHAPAFKNDWIGIYRTDGTPGKNDWHSTSYRYVTEAEGTMTLNVERAPNFSTPIEPGDYFVTYLLRDGYAEMFPRVTFTVVAPGTTPRTAAR